MSGLDVVSLFAGVGGIDLAAHRAGMTTRLLCEKDEPCRRVLAARFPDAVIPPDVTELTADDIRAAGAVPERTVLTAGWPCQGNSVAGRRGGMADPRSGLWTHVARLLDEYRPRWFVGENVPGLLSINGGRDFATVLQDLADIGYGFATRVLDARYFGVPQRRRRVVIVGCLGDTGAAPAQILLEPESRSGDSPQGRAAGSGASGGVEGRVGDASPTDLATHTHTRRCAHGERRTGLADRSRRSRSRSARRGEVAALTASTGGPDDNAAQAGHLIVTALTPRAGATFDDQQIGQLVVGVLGQHAHTLTAEGADAGEDGTGRGTPVVSIDMRNAARSSGTGAGTQGDGIREDGISYGLSATSRAIPAIAYPLAVRGREGGADLEAGEPGDPMFALRAGDGGSSRSQLVAIHENQRGELNTQPDIALNTGGGKPGRGYPAITDAVIVRRLTPLECERLQGLPDDWTDVPGTSDSQRYRECGNSVAVPVFAWVFTRLAATHAEMSEAVA